MNPIERARKVRKFYYDVKVDGNSDFKLGENYGRIRSKILDELERIQFDLSKFEPVNVGCNKEAESMILDLIDRFNLTVLENKETNDHLEFLHGGKKWSSLLSSQRSIKNQNWLNK